MKIVWNGIVKNEAARLERLMKTLLPHVDGAIILDTGSTDATIKVIKDFFDAAHKPCEVAVGEFKTWEQARNDALTLARNSTIPWDWLFLVDADMELVVTDPEWKKEIKGGLGYSMYQQAGSVRYVNSRLVSRQATGLYRGVTHEYLDISVAGPIKGAYFIDNADGANRPGKAARDADLLREGLKTEPTNGRYWYYLGQSLRDDGKPAEAIPAFEACLKYSNWDEEKYVARNNLAHCHLELGDRGAFYREMLDAFNERPTRAEALYDLAKHFRERGQNHASLIFSEFGLTIKQPNDILFVNEYPYKTGFKEEYAICGYYDPKRRHQAHVFTDQLSLSIKDPPHTRLIARNNMFWSIRPLKDYCASFTTEKIDFTPPKGWAAMNPALSQTGDLSVRCVNYTITPWGSYDIREMDAGQCEVEGAPVTRDNPIKTRNFVRDAVGVWREVIPPPYERKYNLVVGPEDMRLFRWNGELWSISNFRDRHESGACIQHLAKLVLRPPLTFDMEDFRAVQPQDWTPAYAEKNWMPWPRPNGALWLVYRVGTVLDDMGLTVYRVPKESLHLDVEHLSGGGCVVSLGDGLWLTIVHEVQLLPNESYNRYYYHRFVVIKDDGSPLVCSPPFIFYDKQIEFAAGLAILGDKVWISYGVKDVEPWLACIDLLEVRRMLGL